MRQIAKLVLASVIFLAFWWGLSFQLQQLDISIGLQSPFIALGCGILIGLCVNVAIGE